LHNFPLDPTPDTLSFFVVWLGHHIEPRSVGTYLSGICDRLEVHYPDVRANRNSQLVRKTLAGMKRLRSRPVQRKLPLTTEHLLKSENRLSPSSSYDDILFVSMAQSGFSGLLRLGELTIPDNPVLRNVRKIISRSSVRFIENGYTFTLPFHKADRFYEGNKVSILNMWGLHSREIFSRYLHLRDSKFPFHPHLWITNTGEVPSRSWFIRRLRELEPDSRWADQSLRAGCATKLAEQGTPPHLIQ
ncbi:hypothetical protein K435DRAFT_555335, partial [Dendrothele bispora CBS 962.96]